MTQATPIRERLMDSPWYWVHLFCVASLVGLVLVAPKFAQRQSMVERKFQGRQRASLQRNGKAAETSLSMPDSRHVVLLPLYIVLGLGAAGSWIRLWHSRYRSVPNAALEQDVASGQASENAT